MSTCMDLEMELKQNKEKKKMRNSHSVISDIPQMLPNLIRRNNHNTWFFDFSGHVATNSES